MSKKKADALIEENRQSWDALAPVHARGSGTGFYRMEGFLAGECMLSPWEVEELGPVKGKSLVHLQCHIGMDTLSWARRGAKVSGLDFSTASIKEARRLAKEIDVAARFVTGRAQEAARKFKGEQFDIVYTGRGALCWLPDLKPWAEQCAALSKPGGVFFMEECHPTLELMDLEKNKKGKARLVPYYDAFSRSEVSETSAGSYADRKAKTGLLTTHSWEHSFGEILGALVEAGFELVHLRERDKIYFEAWEGVFKQTGPTLWEFKKGAVRFPLTYTLKMRKRK